MTDRITIGWREWVALPSIGIHAVKAKVDTGARTSCLHAFEITPFDKNGENWVRFLVHPIQHRRDIVRTCEAKVIDRRHVTDSGGHHEMRFVVEVSLRIAGQSWPIELTLKNRETMMFRMLLGRTALERRFIIDPEKSFLLDKIYPADIARLYT